MINFKKEETSIDCIKKPTFLKEFNNIYHKKINLITNYLSINIAENIIKIYSIKITPEIEGSNYVLLKQIYKNISNSLKNLNFNPFYITGLIIYTCSKNSPLETIKIPSIVNNIEYTLEISLTKKTFEIKDIKSFNSENLIKKNFLESLLKKIISLNSQIVRFEKGSFFKYDDGTYNKQTGEYILNGYQTSSIITEIGLSYLVIDKRKSLSGTTVLEKLNEIRNNNNENFKNAIRDFIVGKRVLAGYGNYKLYKIEDISFDKNCLNTNFEIKKNNGILEEISIKNYYKKMYNIEIKNIYQPLLISKNKKKDDKNIYLIPELLYLTQIDEKKNSDKFNASKPSMIKLNPNERFSKIKDFIKLIENKSKIKKEISPNECKLEWGLETNSFHSVEGKVLKPPQIKFNGNNLINIEKGKFKYQKILEPKNLADNDWICITTKGNSHDSKKMLENIIKCGKNLGINIFIPKIIEINAKYSDDFIEFLQENKNKFYEYKLICVILDKHSENFYNKIKEYITINLEKPSQFLRLFNLKKQMKNGIPILSYYSNVLIQIQNKLNSSLFNINLNFFFKNKRVLIMGLDSLLVKNQLKYSLTCSINYFHGYYCNYQNILNENNEENLRTVFYKLFKNCFDASFNHLKREPTDIFIYRQGGNDMQNKKILKREVPIIKELINGNCSILNKNNNCNFLFCIVNKKTMNKFFQNENGNIKNPESGTIIDSIITRPEYFEFYLQPQYVNQGTANPVHYQILYDSTGIPIEIFEIMSYHLTFYYSNWNGPIPYPAPLQYAIRANMFGNKILNNKQPVNEICNSHYYL